MNFVFAPFSRKTRRGNLSSWVALIALVANLLFGVGLSATSASAMAASLGNTSAANASGAYQTIVVCTVNGFRTIQLDADGKRVPEQSNDASFCIFCLPLNSGHAFIPDTSTVPMELFVAFVQATTPVRADVPVTSVSLDSRSPRAPPSFA